MQRTVNGGNGFEEIMYALPDRISAVLRELPLFVKCSAYEVRLRETGPVCVTGRTNFYISEDAVASTYIPKNPLIPTRQELEEILLRITGRSVYTRIGELEKGYLSMKKGHRAGICGSFTNRVFGQVSSINIRIARQVFGCADSLVSYAENGLIIAGPPGSGKTTLLRDLVRQLSEKSMRVCLIDSRGELYGGGLDVGPNTDVITGLSKAAGVENALRSMFPHYIAFDEIGTEEELSLVSESFFSGVKILTTVHAESIDDLLRRNVTRGLHDCGIENLVLLGKTPDSPMTYLKTDEVKNLA